MPFRHVLAGTEFTEANFAGTAYANEQTGFPKAMEKIVEHVANAYRSPSSSSLTVGIGTKALTVAANRPFAVGQPVRIASTADPANTFMDGSVTSYTDATGAMQVLVASAKGTGTAASWMVSIGGTAQVMASPSPLAVANGGTGASTAATALANLGGLQAVNNLSDLANAATARASLGLGAVAVDNVVPLTRGGTGGADAATALTNLGLGTGTVAIETVVPLAKGGTGATTAAAARTSLGLSAVAIDTIVPVVRGGTGGTDAATARTNLGLGTGTVAIETVVPLAKGGTGATTAGAARTSLGLTAVATDSIVPVVRGGTGAADAPTARTNLGLGSVALDNVVPLARGGTGGADAAAARTNLGLGSVAVESTLPVAKGGTGATTAAQARANLGLTNGPTRPRYNRAQLFPGGAAAGHIHSLDIIPTTAGSGYLNGISFNFSQEPNAFGGSSVKVEVTVDGGAPQAFQVERGDHEVFVADTRLAYTGFIPLFVRFNSSIRVRLERHAFPQDSTVQCVISWSLD